MTPRRLDLSALWHGTAEAIDGPLNPGGYDGVLWTATQPEIARSYIPAAGASMLWTPAGRGLEDQRVTPDLHGAGWLTALALGFDDVEAERDTIGRATSWIGKTPTWHQMAMRLTELGYDPAKTHWIKMREGRALGARERIEGTLHRITPLETLKVADLRTGDFDATEPGYHDVAAFRRLESQGYDAIAIDDMSKDEHGEHLGHESVGLLPSGIAKCAFGEPVPSTHLAFREWFGTAPVLRTA